MTRICSVPWSDDRLPWTDQQNAQTNYCIKNRPSEGFNFCSIIFNCNSCTLKWCDGSCNHSQFSLSDAYGLWLLGLGWFLLFWAWFFITCKIRFNSDILLGLVLSEFLCLFLQIENKFRMISNHIDWKLPIFLKNLTIMVNGVHAQYNSCNVPLMTWLYQLSHYCHWQSWQIQMDLQCSPATNYKVCFNHQCKRIIKTIPKEGKYSNLWGNKCSLSLSFVFFSFPWLLLQLLLPFLCWFLFLTHEILTSFKLSIDLQIKRNKGVKRTMCEMRIY